MGKILHLPERDTDTVVVCPVCDSYTTWALVLNEYNEVIEYVCTCGYWFDVEESDFESES